MTTKTIDLHGPYIRETTDLQYESFVAYFRGDPPLETARNASVKAVNRQDEWQGAPAEAFWRAYDACEPVLFDFRGDYGTPHAQRHNAGIVAVNAALSRRRSARTGPAGAVQAPADPVHEAAEP